ncbi:hypothetical protein BgiMline_014669 [Biomphalaria glabrata]
MKYSSLAQASASQTSLVKLDSVQNQAIRPICGAFRTTSIAADGSTRENLGQKTSGFGLEVQFPGSTENDEILGPCSGKSNYVAEMVAIKNAVEYIEKRINEKTAQPSPIVLFTDSLSCLQAIKSLADTLPEPLAKTLACVARLQEKHDIWTTFQYVPGHVGVEDEAELILNMHALCFGLTSSKSVFSAFIEY